MAGTVAREPAAASSVVAVSQSRANADVRVNRAADRLSQLARAKKLAAQQTAARKAALKRAAAKKAAAKQARIAAAKRAAAKKAAAKRAAVRKAAAKKASRSAVRSIAPNTGSNRRIGREMAAKRGWTGDQWTCLNNLWTKESGWSTRATNGGSAGGIPQALPASKMASAGDDWRTSAATQIKWGLGYISGRYGNPCGAWRHFQNRNWY
jgi:hypothetical protein